MTDHKDIESARSGGQDEDFKARRRLLKASAAVPLIGTLSPGAALAATSTQCDMADNAFPEVVSVDDNALRMRAVYWMSRKPYKRPHLYEVSGEFYDAQSGEVVLPEYKNGSLKGYDHGGEQYVLCYVEVGKDVATGDSTSVHITGFFPQHRTSGAAMSDSCWDSIGGLQSIMYDRANG